MKKEKGEIRIKKSDLEKEDYDKRQETMRKQYEQKRREEYARNFMREYEWWQELRAEHPWNTLDFI